MFVVLSSLGSAAAATGTVTVDDGDAGFVLTGSASDAADGGYQGHFYYRAAASTPSTFGRWTPPIAETGLYTVSGYVPLDPATTEGAPITMHAHGEIAAGTHDQSIIGGDFHSVFGGRSFKLVAGGFAYLEMTEASGESATEHIGFDAFRFTKVGDVGAAVDGGVCATTPECSGDLVCDVGLCRPPCTASGCAPTGTCDAATALCDIWPVDDGPDTADTGTDPTIVDTTDTGTPPVPDDGWPTESTVVVPPEEAGCGCGTGGSAGAWVGLLAILARRRRSVV